MALMSRSLLSDIRVALLSIFISGPYHPASRWMYCSPRSAAKSTAASASFCESPLRNVFPGLIQDKSPCRTFGSFRFR